MNEPSLAHSPPCRKRIFRVLDGQCLLSSSVRKGNGEVVFRPAVGLCAGSCEERVKLSRAIRLDFASSKGQPLRVVLWLDVGCFCGGTGRWLKTRFADVYIIGIEFLAAAAAQARNIYDQVIESPFEAIDFESEGLAAGSIDAKMETKSRAGTDLLTNLGAWLSLIPPFAMTTLRAFAEPRGDADADDCERCGARVAALTSPLVPRPARAG